MSRIEYAPITDHIDLEDAPNGVISIKLKSGQRLIGIIPTSIQEIGSTLVLSYLDQDGNFQYIDVNEIDGLLVVSDPSVYRGKLMIEFFYFNPKSNIKEKNPRRILVQEIYYGVHPNHDGETEDIYVMGQDAQYADQLNANDRRRSFPLWRMIDVYGQSNKLRRQFQTSPR